LSTRRPASRMEFMTDLTGIAGSRRQITEARTVGAIPAIERARTARCHPSSVCAACTAQEALKNRIRFSV
jgi:hypothetical protein